MNETLQFDSLDRQIINSLQGGFPIVDEPYAQIASWFGITTPDLISRIENLLETGALSRFGPLFDSQCMGGAVTLAALSVPDKRYEEVTKLVNNHHQVAHNYARQHRLNMWFVISSETPAEIVEVIAAIEHETGLKVYNCPKEKEFFIGLRLEA